MQSSVSGLANSNWLAVNFKYDDEGQRIEKAVSAYSGSGFTNVSTTRFIRDGSRILAEINVSGNPVRSYLWGLDLSGTLDEAGGIGGLALVREHAGGTAHFPAYDGNGNVMALVNASDQSVSARYEYAPFGEYLRATGPMARSNPYRWSTKYWDEETGWVDYGERVYRPDWGRWLSKDPIGEEGGMNPFAFVMNNPINEVDPLGESTLAEQNAVAGSGISEFGSGARQAYTIYSRVKEAVEYFNDLQEIVSGVSDLVDQEGSNEDFLGTALNAAAEGLSDGLRGKGVALGVSAVTSISSAYSPYCDR